MCEVEEESKQGGRFRGRKEDEATLEDPVQEESDSKSESHVIEAFLTDGHNSKPLSCGKESILARMALWMLSFSWPCLIPLSDTYMMLVLAMHCAVLLVGLRTTATHIVFLLFAATIVSSSFLTLTKLSQSRSSFPAQELSVSLGEVIPLVFLPRAAVFDFYKFIRPLFVLCHSSHNTICASR